MSKNAELISMKKTFSTDVANKQPARQVDAIKHEIKKYIARERRRDLPEGLDFWDFNCRIGESAEKASEVHLSQINKEIDQIVKAGGKEFYIEVLAEAKKRQSKKD